MTLHVPNLSTDASSKPRGAARALPYPPSLYRSFFKRAIDLTLVVLSAPVVLPLIALLALLLAGTGNTPFYSQLRVGRGGVPFRMWKLRTMVQNADAHLEAYLKENPEARREWDNCQKLRNDPRITPLGRILRKTSMDELPQLFNVFNGTMSLVGPRPMMLEQKQFYHGHAYFALRPGITGMWQTSGRNHCSAFEDRVVYDNTYAEQLSLKTDLGLLVKTVGVVCRATGN